METDKFKRRTLGQLTLRVTQLALASLPFAAGAQTAPAPAWPARPVTVVVPFAPGGGTDIAGRLLAVRLGQKWGQTVVVDNRTGAGGVVGAELVAKAKPDGYTLLIGNVGTQSINPSLYKLTYDADKAFAPISLFAELPFAFVVNPSLPAKTPKELIALAKAAPGKYTYASSGSGGSPHLTAEIFQQATGVKFVHVPYKGGGPAMSDLMAGHVDMLFASILETSGYVKTGKLRALAVTSAQRSPAMPEVPTLAELGVPNAESGSWVALLAPAGTPQALVDKIAADVKEAVATEDMRKALIAQGATPRGSTPAELQKTIDADKLRYGQVIKAGGVKVE
ncbi:Bug family tripartite tricarboxylate transporter substrate binding protein [Variovorax arabinosiphilus]|uniref:Bug family tripartite tricarboxylate transporter substrate binding protein n=1 Tax=Variovorax arabinosiphilus TaxID=3053498 RepID=UPI002578A32B|nr:MULTISPECIES: tripartite tricarboxylate transporter substrate binding protein [unclassified Variovorax]MDM0118667.1 tripartite tricarboxylate transporter substrate binding protein [Variovorax sp. J2L1-78]MDM0129092.1 tripartite tricarboxylate transporter substrate binding protein [Variovorax sp. J2L1-63]MDM0233121.1 tripartite tricarboxylate transporter substrate binding protein [Variovorax sp. J2R1-6]